MREFTNSKLSDDERFQTQYRFAGYYASLLQSLDVMQWNNEENYYSKALKLLDTEWSNITAGQRWAAEFIEKDESIAKLCTNYSVYARNFTTLRLHPHQDIEWLEIGLKAARKLENHRAVVASLGSLGLAYYKLGDYRKAIEYHEQALAISRETGNRLGEGTSLGSLGNAYDSLGEKDIARDYYKEAISILEEIESPNAEIFRQNLAELDNDR
jgi:tetratricopeptide (TPR) repeat protein